MDICTIIARNYLAYARVLTRSFIRHNAKGKVYVLVLDDVDEAVGADEDFVVIRPADLDIVPREFHNMAMIYDVMELATAVKPWLLRSLLDQGLSSVAYLDPDIKVYDNLEELSALAEEHGFVLTPHLLRPIARDGKNPSELDILISGTYNLGFIAVGGASRPFLSWWEERLARDCLHDVGRGLFVDQRWIDLAVHYFGHHAVRDDGFNVAYWNLDQRALGHSTRGYNVGGQPLRFFHFSGFDPTKPDILSKHMRDAPRHVVTDGALRQIVEEYAEELLAAGHRQWSVAPYGFSRTASGSFISRAMRDHYRRELLDGRRSPALPDPFDSRDTTTMSQWTGRWRTQAALSLLKDDYRLARSQVGLAIEFGRTIRSRGGVVARTADPRAGFPAVPQQVDRNASAVRGLNVIGNLKAESGVGELGRLATAALRTAGVSCSLFVNPITTSAQAACVPAAESRRVFDQNLVCANADQLPLLARLLGPTLLRGRYNIGYWAWEVNLFPVEMAQSEQFVDEVWALSDYAATAIRTAVSKPVRSFPPPILTPVPSRATRADLGLDAGYMFLFAFDFLSVFERKNPLAVVDAFRLAFPTPCGVTLVVKSVNGHARPAELLRLRQYATERPDVLICDESLRARDQVDLMATCDAYVSLHRAEGFGLTMAEAMSRGKPVIATGYSGNLEFMSPENSFLIPYTSTPVGPGSPPYPATATWADPDIDEASRVMRALVEDPSEGHRRGQRAARDIAERHSVEARAELVRDLLRPEAPRRKAAPRGAALGLPALDGALARVALSASGHVWGRRELARRTRAALKGHAVGARRRVRAVEVQVERLASSVGALAAQLHAIPYTASGHSPVRAEGSDHAFIGYTDVDDARALSYSAFEETFRGSEDFIRERQRVYLPLLLAHQPVVDLGCGRGEMLDLLTTEGCDCVGVDTDLSMAERARAKGLDVVQEDALSWLKRRADASLGSIFSAQVIEHLPYTGLLELLRLSRAKLRPGGLLVAETVNPHALHAWKTFWVDLSHEKPIFPEVLVELCREAGFAAAKVMFPNGTAILEHDRWTEGEFAVVAWVADNKTTDAHLQSEG